MKKVYTLVLMILTFLLGTTGCGQMSSTKYGVLPSDFDPDPTQDEDFELDEDVEDTSDIDEVSDVDSSEPVHDDNGVPEYGVPPAEYDS